MHHVSFDNKVSVVGGAILTLRTLLRQLLLIYHIMSHWWGSSTNSSHQIAVWCSESPHVLTTIAFPTWLPTVVRFELEATLTRALSWGFRGWVELMKFSFILKSCSLITLAFMILNTGKAHFLLLLLAILNDVWLLRIRWLRLRLLIHHQPMRRNLIKILCRPRWF